jgi:hypothetical protein
VDVPQAWLRESRKGPWYGVRDIPAGRIRRVLRFAEPAGASAARTTPYTPRLDAGSTVLSLNEVARYELGTPEAVLTSSTPNSTRRATGWKR